MNKIALTAALVFFAAKVSAAPPLEAFVEKTFPLPANAEVRIRNTDGQMYIYGSEVNELKVYARKKAYSKTRLDAIEVKISVEDGKATIDTIYPPTPTGLSLRDRSGTVDYTILLPQTCSIPQLELANGEILLSGLRGPAVHVGLTNGIIYAFDCFTALQLKATQGGMDIAYNWWERGNVALDAQLEQGKVRLALPPDPAVRLEVQSQSGQIVNDFGQELGQKDGHHLRTTIGADDGAEFRIRTESAGIRIERAY